MIKEILFQKLTLGVYFCLLAAPAFAQQNFKTDFLTIQLTNQGLITSIKSISPLSRKEYVPPNKLSPLLSLYNSKTRKEYRPIKALFDRRKMTYVLTYTNGAVARIKVESKKEYLKFQLLSLFQRNGADAVLWGPYSTTIQGKIGETIGVVRNGQFAIGVQALDIKTIEGLPYGDNNGGAFIEPLPGQLLPDSLKKKIGQKVVIDVNVTGDLPDYVRLYRGSAAVKKKFGSEIRFFSRDYRMPRIIQAWEAPESSKQYVPPIDVDVEGSAIAFFGCPENKVLDVIEKIELNEALPHPVLNGVWIKQLESLNQAYLLNEGDPYQSLKYAKECGFKLIHMGDVFQSWGHFGLTTKRFPKGTLDLKAATQDAHNEHIALGVHTLTMFTTVDDPYVSPIPSDSLCKTGSSILWKNIGKNDKEIFIRDPTYFFYPGRTHTVKINKELINYRAVSTVEPWRLLDCQRGQFGTEASTHAAGTTIDKLTNNVYNGFYPDILLQTAYAKRLADVCNETGIDLMDFDGFPHGASSPSGYDRYADGLFIDTWYKNLDRYRITCGAGPFHYYWHIYSFMNWGEPWYSTLRESQINYRLENQRFFDRNLMPNMLGWFTLTSEFRPEEVEWIQARSAGFDAGYLLRVDESIETNGFRDQLFEAIREWQKVRHLHLFSPQQREKLKDPKNEFHLAKVTDNQWELYPIKLYRGFEHKYRSAQTGEPVKNKFSIINPYNEQALKFYITVEPIDANNTATVSELVISINDYRSMSIVQHLTAGDRLVCDGKSVYLSDKHWKKKMDIPIDAIPTLMKGKNSISVMSHFSGPNSPVLKLDFKTVGEAEVIEK